MSEAVNAIVNEPAKSPVPNTSVENKESMGGVDTDVASPALKDDKVSSRLEMLIRREQQARLAEQAAKTERAQLLKERSEFEPQRQRVSKFDQIKQNPKLALEELGLTYEELTKAMLSDGEVPPEVGLRKLQGEIDGLKQEREQERLKYQESLKLQAQQQEEQAISNFKGEIKTYATDNKARYELINFDERFDEIYELIDAHYVKTQSAHAKELELEGKDPSSAVGKVMAINEACDKIEEYYEKREQQKKELAKLQTIWGAVPKESLAKAVEEARSKDQKKQPPRTLTNNQSATGLKANTSRPPEDKRVAEIIAKWRASKGG